MLTDLLTWNTWKSPMFDCKLKKGSFFKLKEDSKDESVNHGNSSVKISLQSSCNFRSSEPWNFRQKLKFCQ